MNYWINILTLIGIYSLLTVPLGVLVGQLGVFSVAHAAIFGVGAYAFAIVSVAAGLPFGFAVIVGLLAAVAVSALMSIPSLRISGEYFLVASLVMQEIVSSVMSNADWLTGGTVGFGGITPPKWGLVNLNSPIQLMVVTVLILCIVYALSVRLIGSPYGRLMNAVLQDEHAAEAVGKHPMKTKIHISMLTGCVAGIAGILYALTIQYLIPENFSLDVSITLIAMVVVGGMKSPLGALVGTAFIILLPELLQGLQVSGTAINPLRQILFGALLVAFMVWRPAGIVRSAPMRRRGR